MPNDGNHCTVQCEQDYILIRDKDGEIVYWDRHEWHEDPSIVPAIVNAVRIGLLYGGNELRGMLP